MKRQQLFKTQNNTKHRLKFNLIKKSLTLVWISFQHIVIAWITSYYSMPVASAAASSCDGSPVRASAYMAANEAASDASFSSRGQCFLSPRGVSNAPVELPAARCNCREPLSRLPGWCSVVDLLWLFECLFEHGFCSTLLCKWSFYWM